MTYTDSVYGKQEITEPIILELLNSSAIIRLKGVDQYGYFKAFFPKAISSRFDHSAGVYLLLKKFGAPLAEQVSGLIHDVSHSAFSHCIDYATKTGDGGKQDHQDNIFSSYLQTTDIPEILKKYNLDLNYILNDHNFPLKESVLPDLCADRIDYSLRDATKFIGLTETEINTILDALEIKDNNWIFKDVAIAQKYADIFLTLNRNHYAGMPSAIMLKSTGDYLGYALEKKYINNQDIYSTDQLVLDKVAKHHDEDEKLKLFWDRMNNKFKVENNPNDYDIKATCKSRLVDPLCAVGTEIKRLSEINPTWLEVLATEKEPKVYYLKFIV